MPLSIVQKDITTLKVDAIVNAANTALAPGGGVCGAIFSAAGQRAMEQACRKLGGCPTGKAVFTEGFALPAKYVIHTAGPIWRGGGEGEATLLKCCYENALHLALELGCQSAAFPLISAGRYGYPLQEALRIALSVMESFLAEHPMDLFLAVLSPSVAAMAEELRTDKKEV